MTEYFNDNADNSKFQTYVQSDETLDDLQVNGLMVIQKKQGFRFGVDAVLLANFVSLRKNDVIADFCSGSGIISIICVGKRNCRSAVQYELQHPFAEMAQRSVLFNELDDRISVVCTDIGDRTAVKREFFDVVVCNPPYFPVKSGASSENDMSAAARHEIFCDIEKVTSSAAWALKFGGKLALVHRPERLADLCVYMRNNNIEPKRICPVCSKKGQPPVMLLIEGVKGGKKGVVWETPIIVYNDDGTYTPQINTIYGRND